MRGTDNYPWIFFLLVVLVKTLKLTYFVSRMLVFLGGIKRDQGHEMG